jgi:hypothetical protein
MTLLSASNSLFTISVSSATAGRRWSAPTRSCAAPHRGQEEADRVTQRVDQCIDFGAQSVALAPDGLVLTGLFER